MEEVQQMTEPIFPGRFTVPNSEGFVLFRIGMRFNGWRGGLTALRAFASMPGMLAEQRAHPELGMLWTATALSWPVIQITQIWRSFEELERYAKMPGGQHTRIWRWFNKLGRGGFDTGIWHETYRIAPGTYEAVYVNMPRYGIAAATIHEPVTAATDSARARMEGEGTGVHG